MFEVTIANLRSERIKYFEKNNVNKKTLRLTESEFEQLREELEHLDYKRLAVLCLITGDERTTQVKLICILTGYKTIILEDIKKVNPSNSSNPLLSSLASAKTLILQKSMICYRNDPDFLETVKRICKKDCFSRFEEISLLDVKYSIVFNEIQEDHEIDEIKYTFQIILSIQ